MIPKKIQNSIWFNSLLFLVAVFLSTAAYRSVHQSFQFKGETEENKKKIEELLGKKEELELRLAGLQTQEAKERSAKERFNLKKTGEEVVIVLPDDIKTELVIEKKNWLEKIKNIFKND
ncbi:MAG: septum formation initiator family protein [bacterium]|nr:septum formation initiator family protein [bacterium]